MFFSLHEHVNQQISRVRHIGELNHVHIGLCQNGCSPLSIVILQPLCTNPCVYHLKVVHHLNWVTTLCTMSAWAAFVLTIIIAPFATCIHCYVSCNVHSLPQQLLTVCNITLVSMPTSSSFHHNDNVGRNLSVHTTFLMSSSEGS